MKTISPRRIRREPRRATEARSKELRAQRANCCSVALRGSPTYLRGEIFRPDHDGTAVDQPRASDDGVGRDLSAGERADFLKRPGVEQRRYSITFQALRDARITYQRVQTTGPGYGPRP